MACLSSWKLRKRKREREREREEREGEREGERELWEVTWCCWTKNGMGASCGQLSVRGVGRRR